MQLSFDLRRDKIDKHGLMPVRASITFQSLRLRRVVKGVKSSQKHWNHKTNRIKASLKKEEYNYHVEFNERLNAFEKRVKDIFRYYHLHNIIPTRKDFLQRLDADEEPNIGVDFFHCFEEFIEKGKMTKQERTTKSYVTAKNFYKAFQEYSAIELQFDTIDNDFFERFQSYCFEVKKTKNNYFARLVTTLKTFMRWALSKEYHSNSVFLTFKASEEDIEIICLTLEELLKLHHYSFKSQKFERVRDVYCFGCYTGLRFSDIRNLKISNIFKDELRLNIVKTKSIDHRVPLNDFAKAILAKYKNTIYEPLPIISSQKFNSYIKECCKEAEINTPITITRFIGKNRIDTTEPKYKFITSHTARKTFATISLILGMQERAVRTVTGHKKEENFRKYVDFSKRYIDEQMGNAWNSITPKENEDLN